MISLEEFVTKFKSQFVDVDDVTFTADTVYKDIASWDSLTAMAVVVMVSEEFKVDLPDAAFNATKTIADLYNYINSK